ncbi:MAG: hypothetical protein M0P52_12320 [Rhodoferax sp.]|nr:hypothetical protein [Rhodoferax sp.]
MMRRKYVDYPQHGWHDDIPHTQECLQVQAVTCKAVITDTLMRDWLQTPLTS